MTYARDTSVPVARSRTEIEDLIIKAGGDKFMSGTDGTKATVIFELDSRRVMFELTLPDKESFRTRPQLYRGKRTGKTLEVPEAIALRAWEQACRSAWRALALTVKAKITSVESGIETFEEAFLAQVVVRDAGKMRRFGEVAARAIAESYSGKNLPPLLGSGS